jgi:hypothetical protein
MEKADFVAKNQAGKKKKKTTPGNRCFLVSSFRSEKLTF